MTRPYLDSRISTRKSASRQQRPTDEKRVYRYLRGETSREADFWAAWLSMVQFLDCRVNRKVATLAEFDQREPSFDAGGAVNRSVIPQEKWTVAPAD
jgi:hypothetical protein